MKVTSNLRLVLLTILCQVARGNGHQPFDDNTTIMSCATSWNSTSSSQPSPPLTIMILSEPNPLTYMSGQSARFRYLLDHLEHRYPEDQVHLVTCQLGKKKNSVSKTAGKDKNLTVHYTSGFQIPQYDGLALSLDWKANIWRLSGQHQFDILHVSSPGLLLFPAIFISRLRGIPLVMSYHTHIPVYIRSYFRSPWSKFLEWTAWKMIQYLHFWADLTLVTSPQIGLELERHGITNSVWPKGVDTERFHPNFRSSEMRKRMSGGHPEELLLVYIGRMAKEKRIKHLRPIIQQLLDEGIHVRLCLVGDGPEIDELKTYFDETPTIFLGSLEGTPLSEAFASGDIFIMPSDSETLGFVVMESMASGVPVVAANAGGLVDLIEDGKTGCLHPLEDKNAFVKTVKVLHQTPSIREQLAKNARSEAERWSWISSMDFLRINAYDQAKTNFSRRFGLWFWKR